MTITIDLTAKEEVAFTYAASKATENNLVNWHMMNDRLLAEEQEPLPKTVTPESMAKKQFHALMKDFVATQLESNLDRVVKMLRSQASAEELILKMADISEKDPAALISAVNTAVEQSTVGK